MGLVTFPGVGSSIIRQEDISIGERRHTIVAWQQDDGVSVMAFDSQRRPVGLRFRVDSTTKHDFRSQGFGDAVAELVKFARRDLERIGPR